MKDSELIVEELTLAPVNHLSRSVHIWTHAAGVGALPLKGRVSFHTETQCLSVAAIEVTSKDPKFVDVRSEYINKFQIRGRAQDWHSITQGSQNMDWGLTVTVPRPT
jgi:hypothetical protein